MKKTAIFFAAVVGLACMSMFSSCEMPIQFKGETKFFVRGFSIGTGGINSTPKSLETNDYQPVKGYKITLENGKTYTSDKNGVLTMKLDDGVYIVKKIELPSGYYTDFKSTLSGGEYTYTLYNPWDKGRFEGVNYDYGYIYVNGHEDNVVYIYTK